MHSELIRDLLNFILLAKQATYVGGGKAATLPFGLTRFAIHQG